MKGKAPLDGIVAMELGGAAAGPLTTKYLADFGARVIKIESHTRPDASRFGNPFKDGKPGVDRNAVYPDLNSSKYNVSLDLAKPKGKEVLWRLVKLADIMFISYSPGVAERMGFGYDAVKKVKPDIIYCTCSLQGETGPYAHLKGMGTQAGALAGISQITGWPDREPSQPFGAITDYFAPRLLAFAILAALDYRRRTGNGQWLDQSQVEAGVYLVGLSCLDYNVNRRVAVATGNRSPYASPHGVFPCTGEDQWCTVAVFSDGEWQAFCEVIGKPTWTRDHKFATLLGRKQNEDELERLVGEWTGEHTPEEVMTLMQTAGVAAGVVGNTKDVFEDPQLRHRAHFRWLKHQEIGTHAYNGPGFRLSKTPDCQSAGPCLGEHNEYIYKEILGMSDDEIADLLAEGVITTEDNMPEFSPAY